MRIVNYFEVNKFETRTEMGIAAANDCVSTILELLKIKSEINMIFAAAPSQNEFLENLISHSEIDFSRINAFHMDEYIGLKQGATQSFGHFLFTGLFSKVEFKTVNYINGNEKDTDKECSRYSELLKKYPTDIVCMGIGENGHIAFNDPHVAFFYDNEVVKVVDLDEICRNQQVNDGCFQNIEEVPQKAITLTIPTLKKADYHFCMVPGIKKANAVAMTINGEITPNCPATILRRCKNAKLYLDKDSSSLLEG